MGQRCQRPEERRTARFGPALGWAAAVRRGAEEGGRAGLAGPLREGGEANQWGRGRGVNGPRAEAGLRAETEEGERSLFSFSNIPQQFPNTNSKQFEV